MRSALLGASLGGALLGIAACGEETRGAVGPAADGATATDGGASLDASLADSSRDPSDGASPRDAALPPPPSGVPAGANPYPGGTEFRVWAPNARAVAVVGPFAASPVPLAAEPGGRFAAKVPGAHAGQTYHYVVTAADGSSLTRRDPRAREEQGTESVIVDPAAYVWQTPSFTGAARAESVLYELHVGSFAPPGSDAGAPGTFASVAQKLDYLRDLGVTTLELMPVSEFPGGATWGYDPTGFYAPKPLYGSPEDLRRLVDLAHARGIGVLIDVVYNHTDGGSAAPLRCWDAPWRRQQRHLLLRSRRLRLDAVGPAPRFQPRRGPRLPRRRRLHVAERVPRRRLSLRLDVEHPRHRRPGRRARRGATSSAAPATSRTPFTRAR